MRHAGFTWIELVLVLAVIAILGAMAIPGMQDTQLKKQVREGLELADVAKTGVQSYWAASAELPKNNDEAGIPAKDKIVGNVVKEVEVDYGAIHVTMGNNASKALAGMRPAGIWWRLRRRCWKRFRQLNAALQKYLNRHQAVCA